MNNNSWSVESISSVKSSPPTKEEMENLLPPSWPPRWEEVDRHSQDGMIVVSLAHINPNPEENVGVTILKSSPGLATGMIGLKPGKFDFVGHLSITGYGSEQAARQYFESYQKIAAEGLSTPAPGTSVAIPLGDLIKAFAPEEMAKELESALEKGKRGLAESGVKFQKGEYLGEEALFVVDKDGKRSVQAVLIDNFVITGPLLMSDVFESGNRRIHAVKCRDSHSHPPCSTLKAEGFLHREEVEQINRSVFSQIKREKQESGEVNAEIMRGKTKMKNPKGKIWIQEGDLIKTDFKTQVKIVDVAGNRAWIGENAEVEIKSPFIFKLSTGSITVFIKKLEAGMKFEIRTPVAVVRACGTIFSVWTDKTTTTLTVVEGEVEFSDLKGNKVTVKANQSCICSKDRGLQKPITFPFNLKEQFKTS